MRNWIVCGVVAVSALAAAAVPGAGKARDVKWEKVVIDPKFRAEGAAVADVNRDGKVDILAGELWYEGPNWTPHEIKKPGEYNGATGYSQCFLCFAADVDGDGWTDQIAAGFPGAKIVWYRNPGNAAGPWTEGLVTDQGPNESPLFVDVDGDRKPELVCPYKGQMAYYQPGPKPLEGWIRIFVGEPNGKGQGHGLGAGDVNGDGRTDILCKEGYWEAPPAGTAGLWKFVAARLGLDCAQMYAHDFSGDGQPDVISSSAHGIGVWWHERKKTGGPPEFEQHTIDTTFSQSHSLMTADLNGDGQNDFVTGKRWWAHGPTGDVNPADPAVLVWYEFKRGDGKVEWIRHEIDGDSGIGTQFTIADVNADRKPDLVIANKKGVFLFRQQ